MTPGDLTVSEFTSGALLVAILEQLKKWFPWLAGLQGWILRLVSILWGLLTTMVLSWEWQPNEGGGGSLHIVVPSLAGILVALWHWVSQVAIQETIYRTTVKK